jgi:hypothetical protein
MEWPRVWEKYSRGPARPRAKRFSDGHEAIRKAATTVRVANAKLGVESLDAHAPEPHGAELEGAQPAGAQSLLV